MRKFFALVILAASIAVPATSFAADFSTVTGVDKALKIVERVTNRSIFQDIRRVQSYDTSSVDGSGATIKTRLTNEQAVAASNNVVIGICQAVQQINNLSTEQCGTKTEGRTRQAPKSIK